MDFDKILRHVPDFPEEGIDFIDITTVLGDAEAFHEAISAMIEKVRDLDIDVVVGAESRGFIIGAPLAYALGCAFVPVRKKGRLPYDSIEVDYSLEYGTNTLEMHVDAIKKGQKVLIVDDLLATGGTALANCQLVEKLGGEVQSLLFFIELSKLGGRDKIKDYRIDSIVTI